MDKLTRTRLDRHGKIPFAQLPAKASEQVRKQVQAELKSWALAIKSLRQSPDKFEGLPKMPGYLPKEARMPVKFFAGSLGARHLPSIAGRAPGGI